jgi:hypothetical protein
MAQAVSRWPLTAEDQVRSQDCWVLVDKVTLGRFLSEFFGFPPASHHVTTASAAYSSVTAPRRVR